MTHIKWENSSTTYLDDIHQRCLDEMSRIDDIANHKWHFYRKLLNYFDFESREVAVNRAFYKLWEIIKTTNIPISSYTRSLHLAEAPGSFVQVVKKLNKNIKTLAVSRPPATYADVVKKGRMVPLFSSHVVSLPNSTFLYRDLLCRTDVKNMVVQFMRDTEFVGYDFITADGGFDEQEQYDAKEILHFNLILAEIVCILLLQKKGGICVLKIFETFTETTLSILFILTSCYETFDIIKPSTSRPTNAERYLVCTNFKGTNISLDDIDVLITNDNLFGKFIVVNDELPDIAFRSRVINHAKNLGESQIKAIEQVIDFVDTKGHNAYINKKPFADKKKTTFEEWKAIFNLDEHSVPV